MGSYTCLLLCNDLVAEEAVYHSSCMAKFRLKLESSKEKGRSEDVIIKELFEKTCHRLESEADSELYTIDDLFMKMQEFNGSDEIICSEKTIKRKLQDRYGDHLFFYRTLHPYHSIDLDKSFASKWLVDYISKFGFSITADEVLRYKESAIESSPNHIVPIFAQWVGDNIDHNLMTLTGKGTFHGMGVISALYGLGNNMYTNVIKHNKERRKTSFIDHRGIGILPSGSFKNGLITFTLNPYVQLLSPYTPPDVLNCDMLWKTGYLFASKDLPSPNWSGFMQHVTQKFSNPGKASINFLPIIDLKSTDERCIYSTLVFIIEQAKNMKIPTPSVTFDQPLWYKAMGIKAEQHLQIVIRLGGFHTMISFMGCIGMLMRGSGLADLLEEVYSEVTVKDMMVGKAVSRAIRGHLLTEGAGADLAVLF